MKVYIAIILSLCCLFFLQFVGKIRERRIKYDTRPLTFLWLLTLIATIMAWSQALNETE